MVHPNATFFLAPIVLTSSVLVDLVTTAQVVVLEMSSVVTEAKTP
jgi:hypothetical protein